MNRPLRIVIADDEADVRDHLMLVLPRIGHEVIGTAENGRDLVEKCRSLRPDLVITDIKMPEMDGIDAAVKIYEERPIPVIVVSAYHDQELIDRAQLDHIMGYRKYSPKAWNDERSSRYEIGVETIWVGSVCKLKKLVRSARKSWKNPAPLHFAVQSSELR